jgi:hypothetical protein
MTDRPASNHSTGPKTESGKKRVSFNAVKHGIFVEILFQDSKFQAGAKNFEGLLQQLREAIRPASILEDILVDQLAITLIRLARLYTADSEIAPAFFSRLKESTDDASAAIVTAAIEKADEVAFFHRGPSLDSLVRYESSLDRKVGKLLDQIEQARRIGGLSGLTAGIRGVR